MGGAPHVAAPGGIAQGHARRDAGDERGAHRPEVATADAGDDVGLRGRPSRSAREIECAVGARQSVESGLREVRRAARPERHRQAAHAVRQRGRRERHRVGGEDRHLVLVDLEQVEAAQPLRDVGQRARRAQPARLHGQQQRVEVAVDDALEVLPEQLRRLQVHLEARDEVHVQRVQLPEQRHEAGPGPSRHAAVQHLAAALAAVVEQLDPVVRVRHLDQRGVRRQARQRVEEVVRAHRQVVADLQHRDDLPVGRQRGVQPPSAYAIPPHSSTGPERTSRPWIMSHTNVPMTPTRFRRAGGAPPADASGGSVTRPAAAGTSRPRPRRPRCPAASPARCGTRRPPAGTRAGAPRCGAARTAPRRPASRRPRRRRRPG